MESKLLAKLVEGKKVYLTSEQIKWLLDETGCESVTIELPEYDTESQDWKYLVSAVFCK